MEAIFLNSRAKTSKVIKFETQEYNQAGKVLIGASKPEMDYDKALEVINNWRFFHNKPLNTFQRRLRRIAQEVDSNSLVVQRLKRMNSIKHKLERFPTMRLIQIQDIGGCRAIVSTIDHLKKLVDIFALRDKERYGRGFRHKLIDEKNYINRPKDSGYRGVHLIFKYSSDKAHEHDGLKIEIQFRTFIQHAWATAVETVGIFIGQALKSSIGEADWLRFFALAASAMAAHEGCPSVPSIALTPDELRSELRRLFMDLDVAAHLRAYNVAMKHFDIKETSDAHYYLLELDTTHQTINVRTYKQGQLQKASDDYLHSEKNIKNDTVLVAADSVSALKRAYPNYFVDTENFINLLKNIIA